jgi:hypothetical protein
VSKVRSLEDQGSASLTTAEGGDGDELGMLPGPGLREEDTCLVRELDGALGLAEDDAEEVGEAEIVVLTEAQGEGREREASADWEVTAEAEEECVVDMLPEVEGLCDELPLEEKLSLTEADAVLENVARSDELGWEETVLERVISREAEGKDGDATAVREVEPEADALAVEEVMGLVPLVDVAVCVPVAVRVAVALLVQPEPLGFELRLTLDVVEAEAAVDAEKTEAEADTDGVDVGEKDIRALADDELSPESVGRKDAEAEVENGAT